MVNDDLALYVDTGGHGAGAGSVAAGEEGRSQFAATAAAGCDTQLGLQVAQAGSTGGNGFLNLAVCNGIADTYKHFRAPCSVIRNEIEFYYRGG